MHVPSSCCIYIHPMLAQRESVCVVFCVQIFDLVEGRPYYTLHGHKAGVLGVDFSPTGEFFSSVGADEQVHTVETYQLINFSNHIIATLRWFSEPMRATNKH